MEFTGRYIETSFNIDIEVKDEFFKFLDRLLSKTGNTKTANGIYKSFLSLSRNSK